MTSNAGAIVQHVQHDFQNLLADITSADARGDRLYGGIYPFPVIAWFLPHTRSRTAYAQERYYGWTLEKKYGRKAYSLVLDNKTLRCTHDRARGTTRLDPVNG